MSNWLKPIDIYCERQSDLFWAEPINAITNLSFIIAAYFIFTRSRSQYSFLLSGLLVMIGFGSFLFHTFANRLTGLIDIAAIAIYMLTFAFLIPTQWQKRSILIRLASILFLVFTIFVTSVLIRELKPTMSWLPSGFYLGAWFTLIIYTFVTKYYQSPAAIYLTAATVIFIISLISRQLDGPLCEQIGGTHWLWHILNGLTLYLCTYGLCRPRNSSKRLLKSALACQTK